MWRELKEFIRKYKRFFILSLLIFLLISCGWIFYTKIILKMISHSNASVPKYRIPQKVDTKLSFILKNPVNFIPIYFKTLLYKSDFYVRTFLGCSLGYFHIQINMISTIVYAILLIFSIFITQESKECDRKTKIVNSIIFVVIFNIILLGLYIGWGIITDITIEGVQGRYFIPIAILLLLIPIRKDQKIKMKNVDFIIAMIFIINHILIVKDIITCFLS